MKVIELDYDSSYSIDYLIDALKKMKEEGVKLVDIQVSHDYDGEVTDITLIEKP
jgi:hypothetical protein